MLRFRGADAKTLLGPVLQFMAPCPADATCTPSEATLAGRPVTRVEKTYDSGGQTYVSIYCVFGDTLVMGPDDATFGAIISALPAPDAPLPSVGAPANAGSSAAPNPTLISPTPTK